MDDVSVGRMKFGDSLSCVKTLTCPQFLLFRKDQKREKTKVVAKPQIEGN